MADLKTSVQFIHGIGPQRAKALEKLGIATLGDLISWFPAAMRTAPKLSPLPSWTRIPPPALAP